VRIQEERDRQTVRIAMMLPLVVLGVLLVVFPVLAVAAVLGLFDGLRADVLPVAVAVCLAYFGYVALRIAHRQP
jgi:hypothetical protein